MTKNRYFILGIIVSIIAAAHPLLEKAAYNYASETYTLLPEFGEAALCAVMIGALLGIFSYTSGCRKIDFGLLFINLAMLILIWKLLPGKISEYNLLMCGLLMTRFVFRRSVVSRSER